MSSYRLVGVAAHIEQRWSVFYGLASVSRPLHRMGLSWQTTRPAHPKGDAEAQAPYRKPVTQWPANGLWMRRDAVPMLVEQ